MSKSYLQMSDEEILAMGGPAPVAQVEEPAVVEEEPVVETTAEPETTEEQTEVSEAEGQEGAEAETTEESEEEEGEGEPPAAKVIEGKEVEVPADKKTEKLVKTDKPVTNTDGLPEGAERIFQSFRANGKDMQVRNVDEAIRLMQMGANFSQKNADLKPKLAIIKVLEKNGLLDSEKLSYLIDLHNKNPEAIGKLVKESGIDAHDLADKDVSNYKPKVQKASDAELELDDVLADLKHSKHHDRLLDVVGTKWDEKSRAAAGNNPRVLALLAEQMENGIYDKIVAEVDHQRMLGGLKGVPDLQAYDDIGKELNARGAFDPAPKVPPKKLVTPGAKSTSAKPEDEQRRRAAAPTKAASTTAKEAPGPSPLGMSDADFLAQAKNR